MNDTQAGAAVPATAVGVAPGPGTLPPQQHQQQQQPAQPTVFTQPAYSGVDWSRRIILLGAIALLLAGVAAVYFGQQDRAAYTSIPGGARDETWSYYHDDYFDSDSYSPQYEREGVFEGEQKWQYDGPYSYGSYGSKGMTDRSTGKKGDKVFGSQQPLPNVFDSYNVDADPTGGDPVGDPWAAYLDPTYNPYAAYSNPYANRIRMAFGPGSGQGALYP